MKSRSRELLDRAVSAMIAAVEIYNKPGFPYRTESFAILAVNAWELLLKAKWLAEHDNKPNSLYVFQHRTKKNGEQSLKLKVKRTRSGNPLTHSLDYVAKKLEKEKTFSKAALDNLMAIIEFRDSSIHFYHQAPELQKRVQEIGAACLSNFILALKQWFDRGLSELDLYLMPLSLISLPTTAKGMVLSNEEKKFINYLATLPPSTGNPESDYSVAVNFEIRVSRSKATEIPMVRTSKDPNALPVRMTDAQIREKYPWDYKRLTSECRKVFANFKMDKIYHRVRKALENDERFALVRYLDPSKPRSGKKTFYNPNIIGELGKHYQKDST